MLAYQAGTPESSRLRTSIASYGAISGSGPKTKRIAPRPGAVLVISLAGSFRIEGRPVPQVALFGLQRSSLRLEVHETPTDRIQVLFHPGGLSRFAHRQASALADRVVPVAETLPKAELERLVEELSSANHFDERVALLDGFFERHLVEPSAIEKRIDSLARRLCEDPEASLDVLVREVPAGRRQIERLFAGRIGVSPTTFARLARFDHAKRGILAREERTLTEIGLAAGYYDQAHFGREFRRLAAMTPSSFTACASAEPAAGETGARLRATGPSESLR